jgi:hypothetical protein
LLIFNLKKAINFFKTLLSARCEYYRVLWDNNWSESSSNLLVVEDWSFDAFYKFLVFLYSHDVTLDGDNVVEMLSMANHFNLSKLKCMYFFFFKVEKLFQVEN